MHLLDRGNHVLQIALGIFRTDRECSCAIKQIHSARAGGGPVPNLLSPGRIEGGPSRMWNGFVLDVRKSWERRSCARRPDRHILGPHSSDEPVANLLVRQQQVDSPADLTG